MRNLASGQLTTGAVDHGDSRPSAHRFLGQLTTDQLVTSSIMFKALIILSVLAVSAVQAQQTIQKQKLKFKLSAKGLSDKDDLGTSDPYVELFYTEGSSTKETKFGRSATLTDDENPTWGDVFEFDYDRSKGQRWHFKVYDHDNLREDDKVGNAWVQADDYVDKGQTYTANLIKQGFLTIQKA
ncbi:unnamed protein product [Allacma fusca]|uniref:C2 domain-containing protein n=1 Tax=Allacma fusca TaxID=39272 RepID=A0A8J2L5V7_9HEXA|nr:unnamed protein product [Allacma fusca]